MSWYLKVLKNYVEFSGRARRMEYWMFVLFNVIFAIVAMILDSVIGTNGVLYGLYMLAIIIPSIAVAVRRLHDIEKSGWFFFISLIPIIGSIWLLILMCTEGTSGENDYGADPKEPALE